MNAKLLVLAAAVAATLPIYAQAADSRIYSIAAGTLEETLNRFGRASGIMLSFVPELTSGLRSEGLQGQHTVDAGLAQLLAGSGLEAVRQPNGSYLLRRAIARADASLQQIEVRANPESLPPPAAGGQVASGGRLGLLGNVGVMDTPFNQTSYTAALIENQQARGLMDVLENDPSVRSSAPIGGEADIVMVRGFEMMAREIMVNGVAGLGDNRGAMLEAVERVEVLKGPSALLNSVSPWGSSTGGSINYVLKRAGDDPLTRFTASYANESELGGHLDVGRRFGVQKQFGVRFNTVYKNGDGAIDNTHNRQTLNALALDYRGEKLRLVADASYQQKKLEGGVSASRIGGTVDIPSAPKGTNNFKQPWETYDSEASYLLLGAEYDLAPDWLLSAHYGGGVNNEAYLQSIHRITNTNGDLTGDLYWIPGRSTNRGLDLNLRGKFATGPVNHTVVASVAAGVSRRGQNNVYLATTVNSNLYNPVPRSYTGPRSLSTDVDMVNRYGRDSVAVTDTLGMFNDSVLLMLGLRKQDVDNRSYTKTAGGALVQSFRYHQDTTTPAVGLVLKFGPHVSVYGNYIESLIPGPSPSTYYANSNQVFAPFPSKQYEAGVKYEHDKLTITTSIYQINLQNSIEVASTNSDPRPTLRLDGEQRNRGFEINTFGQAAPGLRLLGGYSYIDARLLHTDGGLTDGRYARGVSKNNVNMGAEWDVPALPGATLSGRMVYTSSQFIDTGNTAARSIPGWTRLDLGARYDAKVAGRDMTFRLNIDNVAGRDYWSSASRGVLVVGAPRSVRLSVSTDL
jgi:iron complex outermembrane receptor protein